MLMFTRKRIVINMHNLHKRVTLFLTFFVFTLNDLEQKTKASERD